jgi:phenylacetate-coenzyme A ligase PaaK-like adenylate-forming protein
VSGPPVFASPQVRRAHVEAVRAAAPEHQRRLTWSRAEIEQEQTRALRALLDHARTRSAFYRERLDGIALESATLRTLASIPVTRKSDLMERWDDVVTDPALRRAELEAYLAAQSEFDYYAGRYQVFESGGSSGVRGIYVWDWDFFVAAANLAFRYEIRDTRAATPPAGRRLLRGVITSGVPPHASTPLFSVDVEPPMETVVFPVSRSLDDTVSAMTELQPTHLIGYSSVIGDLASEATEGRLRIAPLRVATNSEPLLPETRALIERVWGVPVNNAWGSTEVGMHAAECDRGHGLHVHEDAVVLERVDEDDRPVADDEPAARVLLTSLVNLTFPFIRYELDDVVSFAEERCPCGSAYRLLAGVEGRSLDAFSYGALRVAPVVFGRPLASDARIAEYQVRQTRAGADVDVVAGPAVDCDALAATIGTGLVEAGLADPVVRVVRVDALPRNPVTGKLKRFVPLAPGTQGKG